MRDNIQRILTLLLTAIAVIILQACSQSDEPVQSQARTFPSLEETKAIAKAAYLYGFPLVMNYKTMYKYVVDTKGAEYKGPFNQVGCDARLFTPEDKAIVTPNSDTPYCLFWMDLRAEPVVLSVPAMEDRYYSFQLIDLYTHNYAYVGTLTTGSDSGKYLLAGPDWQGKVPEGITDVLRSETNYVFNVTRTQLFGPDDLDNVKNIQAQYTLETLSAFEGRDAPPAQAQPNFPVWEEGSQFDERYFTYLDFMMDLLGKPGPGEEAIWKDLARLGIGPDHAFALDTFPEEQGEALKAGINAATEEMKAFIAKHSGDPLASGKLFGTRDFLNASASTNYQLKKLDMLRTVGAHMGLYGNSAAEAIYPTYLIDADGEPLNATEHNYTITFAKGSLLPVKAFWSLTMYDGKTQLLVDNPLNRYLLNSGMNDQFTLAEDGSLTFYISKDSPGEGLENNWLPAPDGPFYLTMRLYGPDKSALEGSWMPPKIEKR